MLDMCPRDTVVRVASIGVLYSLNGRYYLKDVSFEFFGRKVNQLFIKVPCSNNYNNFQMPHQSTKGPNHVHVSTEYLSSTPSAYIPYTAQVVGDLDWRNVPILYIQLLKPLHPATAVKLDNAMMRIKNNHLATAKHTQTM